jgi:hypothetical protein
VREVALNSSAGLSSAVLASRADQLLRELDEALASTFVRNECTTGLHDGPSASPAITNFTMMAGMQESIAIRYIEIAPDGVNNCS